MSETKEYHHANNRITVSWSALGLQLEDLSPSSQTFERLRKWSKLILSIHIQKLLFFLKEKEHGSEARSTLVSTTLPTYITQACCLPWFWLDTRLKSKFSINQLEPRMLFQLFITCASRLLQLFLYVYVWKTYISWKHKHKIAGIYDEIWA